MQFVASLLPIIIYILVVYKIDHFALVNKRRLLQLVVGGMLMALVCFGLFSWLDGVLPDGSHPVVEEGVKAVPLLVLAGRKRMVFFIDSVICGAAVGGGFSILENLFYLVLGQDAGLGTMLFRGLEVALVHIGCSAVVAAGLVLVVRQTERWRSRLGVKPFDVVMTILLLVAAVAAHVCHNHLHFNPVMQFVSVLVSDGWSAGMDLLLRCGYDSPLARQGARRADTAIPEYPRRAVDKHLYRCFPRVGQGIVPAIGLFRYYLLCAPACRTVGNG